MAVGNHGFNGQKNIYDLQGILDRLSALETATGSVSFDKVYPVGSIYITTNSSMNPHDTFGGSWERYAQGKVLVGYDANDDLFKLPNGGSKTVNFTPSGTVGETQLTEAQMPSHYHDVGSHTHVVNHNSPNITDKGIYWNYHANTGLNKIVVMRPDETITSAPELGKFEVIGVAQAEDRSRNSLITGAPSGGTSTKAKGGNGKHGHSFSGASTSVSTVQPFITCYIWRRKA